MTRAVSPARQSGQDGYRPRTLSCPSPRQDDLPGLVLLACTPEANRAPQHGGFAAREVSKQYLALSDRASRRSGGWVQGTWRKGVAAAGCWPAPSRTRHQLVRFGGGAGGAAALSHQTPDRQDPPDPVALKSIGAPHLGDARYGGAAADRGYSCLAPAVYPGRRLSISSAHRMRGRCSSCPNCTPPSQDWANDKLTRSASSGWILADFDDTQAPGTVTPACCASSCAAGFGHRCCCR